MYSDAKDIDPACPGLPWERGRCGTKREPSPEGLGHLSGYINCETAAKMIKRFGRITNPKPACPESL